MGGLHYNIPIHLPATKDVEVYNAIFKSLREHLGDYEMSHLRDFVFRGLLFESEAMALGETAALGDNAPT